MRRNGPLGNVFSRGEADLTGDAIQVRTLSAAEAHALVPSLSAILIDCVEGGASVSFMAPLTPERADRFWQGVAMGVAAGDRILLVAQDGAGEELLGTVQVVFAQQENQPHRADIAKMLVRCGARRRGICTALMRAAEDASRAAGRTVLVLDTTTGSEGERLYARAGWTRVGEVPGYALMPDGRPSGTTYFYKRLG